MHGFSEYCYCYTWFIVCSLKLFQLHKSRLSCISLVKLKKYFDLLGLLIEGFKTTPSLPLNQHWGLFKHYQTHKQQCSWHPLIAWTCKEIKKHLLKTNMAVFCKASNSKWWIMKSQIYNTIQYCICIYGLKV